MVKHKKLGVSFESFLAHGMTISSTVLSLKLAYKLIKMRFNSLSKPNRIVVIYKQYSLTLLFEVPLLLDVLERPQVLLNFRSKFK